MNRWIFALAFVGTLLAAALVVVMMEESKLRKENVRLRDEASVEIGYVHDGKRVWLRVKSKYRFDAISCNGDSISVRVGTADSDMLFEKVNIADLLARRLLVSIDVRGNYIFAEAQNGSATVEMKRDIREFGLVRLEKPR